MDSWSDELCFTRNRSFLYRLVEARNSWASLYEDGTQDPLGRIRDLSRAETFVTIRAEILFWHAIVMREYTASILSQQRPANAFVLKRYAWIMMKATSELWNFRRVLGDYRALLFTRREILRTARSEAGSTRWTEFFKEGEALLNNRLRLRDATRYADEAHAYLSAIYGEFHEDMNALLDGEPGFVGELRRLSEPQQNNPEPEFVPIALDGLPELALDNDDRVVAVVVSPRPVDHGASKVLVIIVLSSLEAPPLTSIDAIRDRVFGCLSDQGVGRTEIDCLLVDCDGYRCFGVVDKLAANARFLVDRRGIGHRSLGARLFEGTVNGTATPDSATIRGCTA